METQTADEDLVGTADLMTALNVDRATIARWVDRGIARTAGKLPGPNGAFLFERSEIERLREIRGDRKQMPKAAAS